MKIQKIGISFSSDDEVVRASASGALDSGLIPSLFDQRLQKLVFITFLLNAQHMGTVWRRRR